MVKLCALQSTSVSPCDDFDLIMVDEAHDASSAMLEMIVGLDDCRVLLVYDVYQRVYSSFGAASSSDLRRLIQSRGVTLPLSRSWRFSPAVARIASRWLSTCTGNAVSVLGNTNRKTSVSLSECAPVEFVREIGSRLGVVVCKNVTAVRVAYDLLRRKQVVASEVAFTNGAFVFVDGSHPNPADVVVEFAEFAFGQYRGLTVPALCRFATFRDPLEALRHFCYGSEYDERRRTLGYDGTVNLCALLSLYDEFGPTLHDVVSAVGACSGDPSSALVTLSTTFVAKGLEWPCVFVGDDHICGKELLRVSKGVAYRMNGPANAYMVDPSRLLRDMVALNSERLVHRVHTTSEDVYETLINVTYVALTRCSEHLFIGPCVSSWLVAAGCGLSCS